VKGTSDVSDLWLLIFLSQKQPAEKLVLRDVLGPAIARVFVVLPVPDSPDILRDVGLGLVTEFPEPGRICGFSGFLGQLSLFFPSLQVC